MNFSLIPNKKIASDFRHFSIILGRKFKNLTFSTNLIPC